MKRKRFTEEQIAFALRQAESGTTVEEICRKMGVSEPTFYRWKKQFVGMGVTEIRRLKRLKQEAMDYTLRAERLEEQAQQAKRDEAIREWKTPT